MSKKHTGVMLTIGLPTANSNVYTREAIEKAVSDFQKKLDADEVAAGSSHSVSNIWLVGDDVYVTVEATDTEKGKLLQQMMEGRVRLFPSGKMKWDEDGNVTELVLDGVSIMTNDFLRN